MASYPGTTGDDNLVGSHAGDFFDLTGGGADTMSGRAGNDYVYIGGTLGGSDRLDGGTGHDDITLNGDYSAGLLITGAMVFDFDSFTIAAGFDYDITVRDGVNSTLFSMGVYGYQLGVDDSLRFDASQETASSYYITGGAGADTLIGGGGADTMDMTYGGRDVLVGGGSADYFYASDKLTKEDRIDGGDGYDALYLNGDYNIRLQANTIRNIEVVYLSAGRNYRLTLDDGNVSVSNSILQVRGDSLNSGERLTLDGSAETDGRLAIYGGYGSDILIGGGGRDILLGAGGADTLIGGAEDDVITGSQGADRLTGGLGHDVFSYGVMDLVEGEADLITDLERWDTIDLRGVDADEITLYDQAFARGDAFTGTAGELVVKYRPQRGDTAFLMDTDGDSVADYTIVATGNRQSFDAIDL